MTLQTHIPIGVIRRAHGVRGEVRIELYDAHSAALEGAKSVLIRAKNASDPKLRTMRIVRARRSMDAFLVLFEGISDRNAAEELRSHEVSVERSSLPPMAEGEFLVSDLVGLPAQDENGTALGTITAILSTPAHDLVVIAGKKGEIMIPIVPDFVVSVSGELAVFAPPEGLVEELIEGSDAKAVGERTEKPSK